MRNKKYWLIGIVLVMSLVLMTACIEADDPAVVEYPVTALENLSTMAEGEVLPVEDRALAFDTGGILSQVVVEEGDWVQQGDVLAVLGNTTTLDAQKATREFELLTAQQLLDNLNQNADVDREAAWQAVLDAQDAYDTAQAEYDAYDADGYDDDLEKAAEDIVNARQDVEDAEDDLADYLDLNEDNATRVRYEDTLERAQDTLNEKLRAKTALKTEHDRIESQFTAAEAALLVAQDQYGKHEDGPDADALAQVNVQIESIQAQLTAVEEEIAKLTMTAPFSGEIVAVNYAEQEFISPGSIIFRLADTRDWIVESTDLTELEVTGLSIGQSVSMEADAFEGETFTGMIDWISSYPESKQGDVLYTVHITIDEGDVPDLRWGMTLTLTFD